MSDIEHVQKVAKGRPGRPRKSSLKALTPVVNDPIVHEIVQVNMDVNVSVSPVQAIKKSRRSRKPSFKGTDEMMSFPETRNPTMIDSSSLNKHSEVTFVTRDDAVLTNSVTVVSVPSICESIPVGLDISNIVHVHDDPSVVPHVELVSTEVVSPVLPIVPSPSGKMVESEFFSVEPSVLENIMNDKNNPSENSDNWCRNRFDAWRTAKGIDKSLNIEEIPLKELSQLHGRYFFETAKKNGERYPTESLMNLYNGFNRIISNEQTRRINLTGVQEPLFCITRHPFFLSVNKAINKSMQMSVQAGANKGRKKAKGLTWEDEMKILSHPSHQVTFPRGLLKRLVYYCTVVFFIRGNSEMWKLLYSDFVKEENNAGFSYIKYDERLSKNYRASINRFQEEHFRPSVCSYDPDVLLTWMTLASHYPEALKKSGHLLLSPIDAPLTPVWFKIKVKEGGEIEGVNLGINQLRKYLKVMAMEAGVEGDVKNKSGRVTGVTRMAIAKVPRNVMAEITGHRCLSSLDRYDESGELDKQAAQLTLRNPYNVSHPSKPVHMDFNKFKDAVTEEYHKKQLGSLTSMQVGESSRTATARILPLTADSPVARFSGSNNSMMIVCSATGGFGFHDSTQCNTGLIGKDFKENVVPDSVVILSSDEEEHEVPLRNRHSPSPVNVKLEYPPDIRLSEKNQKAIDQSTEEQLVSFEFGSSVSFEPQYNRQQPRTGGRFAPNSFQLGHGGVNSGCRPIGIQLGGRGGVHPGHGHGASITQYNPLQNLSSSPSSVAFKPILPRPPGVSPLKDHWRPIPPQFQQYRDLGRHNPKLPIYISPTKPVEIIKHNLALQLVKQGGLDDVNTKDVKYHVEHPISSTPSVAVGNPSFDDDREFEEVLSHQMDSIEKTLSQNVPKVPHVDPSQESVPTSSITTEGSLKATGVGPRTVASDLPSSDGGKPLTVVVSSTDAPNQRSGSGSGITVKNFNLNIMNIRDFEEVWKIMNT